MSIVEKIKEKLDKYSGLSVSEGRNTISVTPEGGFTVWAADNRGLYTVGFEGWHEEFKDLAEALNCFGWGLSSECRLEITVRGGVPHKWVAQSLENGQWVNSSTTGLLFFPFWRKAKISYKQNSVTNR
ncbi:hypothetical protein ACRSLK_14575 [Halopseudomonas pachastrellae]|uniref:hypothetical protein n=1 Tax=Halopseudomonas pachastrellae TaxID=254161 RepID=UPI003D7CB6A6